MTQPESKLSRKIIQMIEKRGWFAFKVHGGAMMMAGLPDIVACVNGIFLGIETKLPKADGGGDPTARQTLVHGWIIAACGRAAVCRSVEDAEAVVRGLESIPCPLTPGERE